MEEITGRQLFEVFIEVDRSKDALTLASSVKLVETKFLFEVDDIKKIAIKKALRRKKGRKFTNKRLTVNWSELLSIGRKEVSFTYKIKSSGNNISESSNIQKQRSVNSRKRPLSELKTREQLKRRTQEIWDNIQEIASEENVETSQLLGLLLTRCSNQKHGDIGHILWENKPTESKKISVETALVPYVDCSLGRSNYTVQKRVLAAAGCNIFPAWRHIREKQETITPPVMHLQLPFRGVYFNLVNAFQLTTKRILETVSDMDLNTLPLQLSCKFGLDGSGGHSIYNQKNNDETNNLILSVFCPLELKDSAGKTIWIEPSPNAPKSQRPVMIQTGKESTESLKSFEVFNRQITSAEKEGFVVILPDKSINVKSRISSYTLDWKAANLLLGLGGAYCDLCHISKEDSLNIDQISYGLNITRDVQSLHNLFNELVEEDGTVHKSPKDYSVRARLTQRPIITNHMYSTQVLHALMRSADMFMKIIVHVTAAIYDWSESKSSRNYQFIDKARRDLRDNIKIKTGIKWDEADSTGQGDTSTTRNNCRRLLHQNTFN